MVDEVEKLEKLMQSTTNLVEMGWRDFSRFIELEAGSSQARFCKDVFFAGAFRLFGLLTFELQKMSDEQSATVLRLLQQEFHRFGEERIAKWTALGDRSIPISEWP